MCFFFFNDTATTEIYTLSLHDALPISRQQLRPQAPRSGWVRVRAYRAARQQPDRRWDELARWVRARERAVRRRRIDRKSTRLNSSHANISYAVFCLKKKKNTPIANK